MSRIRPLRALMSLADSFRDAFAFVLLVVTSVPYLSPLERVSYILITPSARIQRVLDDIESLGSLVVNTNHGHMRNQVWRYRESYSPTGSRRTSGVNRKK
jgi:hypothetical protein